MPFAVRQLRNDSNAPVIVVRFYNHQRIGNGVRELLHGFQPQRVIVDVLAAVFALGHCRRIRVLLRHKHRQLFKAYALKHLRRFHHIHMVVLREFPVNHVLYLFVKSAN